MESPSNHREEISVSYRFAQEHNWVIQGITGFFSAYFMEKPGFRVIRHYEELETGMHVWLCEIPPNMRVQGLLRRLQIDLPPFQVTERTPEGVAPITRHVIDCKEDNL
jgi:hypothetical protein